MRENFEISRGIICRSRMKRHGKTSISPSKVMGCREREVITVWAFGQLSYLHAREFSAFGSNGLIVSCAHGRTSFEADLVFHLELQQIQTALTPSQSAKIQASSQEVLPSIALSGLSKVQDNQ